MHIMLCNIFNNYWSKSSKPNASGFVSYMYAFLFYLF